MKKAKLAALITLSLANIAGLCLVTFAWFTANIKINASTDAIAAVALDDITVSHKIFAWDDDLKQGVESFNEDGSYKFSLEQYDSFILDRNANLSKVIRFELDKKVVSTEGLSFGLTIPCSGDFLDSDNHVTNSISNIIRFRYFVDSTIDSDNPNEVYTSAMDICNDNESEVSHSVSFVTLATTDGAVVGNKESVISIEGLNFTENSDKTYFFLEYNYDVDLVNFYYENSDIDAPSVDTLEGDEVHFIGDINRMTFGITDNQ